jgi:hypothetical protein
MNYLTIKHHHQVSCETPLNALQRKFELKQEKTRQGDLWKLLMSEAPLLLSNDIITQSPPMIDNRVGRIHERSLQPPEN